MLNILTMFFASLFSIFFFWGGLTIFLALFFQEKKRKKEKSPLHLKVSILLSNCHFFPQTYEKQECSYQASLHWRRCGLATLLGEET